MADVFVSYSRRDGECVRKVVDGLQEHGRRPSSANFALLTTYRPACDVAAELLAEHGIYVRDCADKRGLDGNRYLRVAARTAAENAQILAGLRSVLATPLALAA